MGDFTFDDLELSENVFDDLLEDLANEEPLNFDFDPSAFDTAFSSDKMTVEQPEEKAPSYMEPTEKLEIKAIINQPSLPLKFLNMEEDKGFDEKKEMIPMKQTNTNKSKTNNKRKNKEADRRSVKVTENNIKNSSMKESLLPTNDPAIDTLLQFPILIFKAFNGGDIPQVRDYVKQYTVKNCGLKTPALDEAVHGQQNVINLFDAFFNSHPDAVFVAKKCKWDTDLHIISCKIYFAGTRMIQAYKTFGLDEDTTSDYLYKKKNSSLVDEMDISMLSEAEIKEMHDLESNSKNLALFGKGTLNINIDIPSIKILQLSFDWKITSFREAQL